MTAQELIYAGVVLIIIASLVYLLVLRER